MIVHVYSITKNDEYFLPYFLRHYTTFADRIFLFDDRSQDKTVEIAKANDKVSVCSVNWPEGGWTDYNDSLLWLDAYKRYSRDIADWVIIVDSDEIVYHANILDVLTKHKDHGEKLLKTRGFAMFSEELPTTEGQIYEQCNTGIRVKEFDKPIIFNPSIDVFFRPGRHYVYYERYNPGEWWIPRKHCGIKLLHYKYLSKEFCVRRTYNYSTKKEAEKRSNSLKYWELGVNRIKDGSITNILNS